MSARASSFGWEAARCITVGEIERLVALGHDDLVELDGDILCVTGKGRLLLRPIAMTFDAYLPRDRATTLYSRTI
jgi:oxygen-independent coproporphyrinogen-3 oxidase